MTALIKKLYASDVVRYVFFGGCTTLVNLVSFFLMRPAGVQRDLANVISIILAILFAYVVNSKFVFQEHHCSMTKLLHEKTSNSRKSKIKIFWLLLSFTEFYLLWISFIAFITNPNRIALNRFFWVIENIKIM